MCGLAKERIALGAFAVLLILWAATVVSCLSTTPYDMKARFPFLTAPISQPQGHFNDDYEATRASFGYVPHTHGQVVMANLTSTIKRTEADTASLIVPRDVYDASITPASNNIDDMPVDLGIFGAGDASPTRAASLDAQTDATTQAAPAAATPVQATPAPTATQATQPPLARKMAPRSISFASTTLSYASCFFSASAPAHGAGLWAGSDSTTDGSYGYFIGHHPGDFYQVVTLSQGSKITVCDGDGIQRDYTVIDVFDVPATSYLNDIFSRACCHGESVVLQTCMNSGSTFRIVVAV